MWQIPHASTVMRTWPGPGWGSSRSTISNFPPGELTWATRMDVMTEVSFLDGALDQAPAEGRARDGPGGGGTAGWRPLCQQRYTHLCSDAISRGGFLYRPAPAPYIVAI
ncbi:hypothetical protein GCM10010359_55980 [Streptomyces morookaense]|nr:hypothetical protein GCM10010359_55980 [Streptomyces morookaense]